MNTSHFYSLYLVIIFVVSMHSLVPPLYMYCIDVTTL